MEGKSALSVGSTPISRVMQNNLKISLWQYVRADALAALLVAAFMLVPGLFTLLMLAQEPQMQGSDLRALLTFGGGLFIFGTLVPPRSCGSRRRDQPRHGERARGPLVGPRSAEERPFDDHRPGWLRSFRPLADGCDFQCPCRSDSGWYAAHFPATRRASFTPSEPRASGSLLRSRDDSGIAESGLAVR